MSSASIPAPRTPQAGQSSRRTFFWPLVVLFVGIGFHSLYQVRALQDQLDEVTRAVNKMDPKLKEAQHHKNLFYALGRDVLALAPKNPNAEQIATDFHLQELRKLQPALFDAPPTAAPVDAPSTIAPSGTPTTPTEIPGLPATNAPAAEH